jgi:syntaxin 16
LPGSGGAEDQQGLLAGGDYHDDGDVVIEMDVLPPRWADMNDEVTELLADIARKSQHLERLHQKHVLPGFNDEEAKRAEENEIERLTQSITRGFHECHRAIQRVESMVRESKASGAGLSRGEEKMAANIQISLAGRVQEASASFRKKQSAYLKSTYYPCSLVSTRRARGREKQGGLSSYTLRNTSSSSSHEMYYIIEEANQAPFHLLHTELRGMSGLSSTAQSASGSASNPYGSSASSSYAADPSLLESESDKSYSQSALQATVHARNLQSNDAAISQREREIEDIAQGIIELSDLFRDLQNMVIDQGTMLDRIDYNVERMNTDVKAADRELNIATGYQKKTTKRKLILLLVLLIVGAIILLVIKPKNRGGGGGSGGDSDGGDDGGG